MHIITLPRKHKPIFPPLCVISGGQPDTIAGIGGSGSYNLAGIGFYMPFLGVSVIAPVRRKLLLEFRISSFIRRFGRTLLIFALIFTLFFVGAALGHRPPLWLVILIAIGVSWLYTLFDLKLFPPPFRVQATQSQTIYMFRDPHYAHLFAELNLGPAPEWMEEPNEEPDKDLDDAQGEYDAAGTSPSRRA